MFTLSSESVVILGDLQKLLSFWILTYSEEKKTTELKLHGFMKILFSSDYYKSGRIAVSGFNTPLQKVLSYFELNENE